MPYWRYNEFNFQSIHIYYIFIAFYIGKCCCFSVVIHYLHYNLSNGDNRGWWEAVIRKCTWEMLITWSYVCAIVENNGTISWQSPIATDHIPPNRQKHLRLEHILWLSVWYSLLRLIPKCWNEIENLTYLTLLYSKVQVYKNVQMPWKSSIKIVNDKP